MTLRDERDNLLDELGGYGEVVVDEDATGFAYVDFAGTRFVDMHRSYDIGLQKDFATGFYTPYWEHLSDPAKEQYTEVFNMDRAVSTEMDTDVGGIKSKLLLRGDRYGRAEDLESTDAYDEISGSTMMEVEARIDGLISRIVTSMNDIYCPNIEAPNGFTGTTADGTAVTYPAGTKILDAENCARGVDGELPPRELFTRIGMDRYTEVAGTDGKTYYVYNEPDPDVANSRYAIGNLQINPELKKQITLMPAYKENGDVAYDFGQKLSEAWDKQEMKIDPYDQKPCTFEEYYDKVLSQLGTEGSTYKSAMETLEGATSSIDNKRQQEMGVSSDEELTSMIKFQSAFNASSRFMTVISEMTELIVTGLV